MAKDLLIEHTPDSLRIFLDDYEVTNIISYKFEGHDCCRRTLTLVLEIMETVSLKIPTPT